MVERKLGPETAASLPGPGHYSTDPCLLHPQTGRPSDIFRSGTRRFHDQTPRDIIPGPGTYLGHEQFASRERGTNRASKGDGDKIKWVRVPTAPSIPGREQSYGYEEGDQGELVMQRPVDKGHSGKGDDRPGPVDYRPKIECTRRSPVAVDFSKGEDRMLALSKARIFTTPGPGHYNALGSLGSTDEGIQLHQGVRRKRQWPTASFHSATKRDRSKREEEPLPGPGDYTLPTGLDIRRDPGRRDLSFLSTSRRFDGPTIGSKSRAPGPGSYVTAHSDFDRYMTFSRHQRSGPHIVPIGFHSTTLRFVDKLPAHEGVSPATYSICGMADEICRKHVGSKNKLGAFGSTVRRFPIGSDGQAGSPGPGSYDLEVGSGKDGDGKGRMRVTSCVSAAGKRLPCALSCFASGKQRKQDLATNEKLSNGTAPDRFV